MEKQSRQNALTALDRFLKSQHVPRVIQVPQAFATVRGLNERPPTPPYTQANGIKEYLHCVLFNSDLSTTCFLIRGTFPGNVILMVSLLCSEKCVFVCMDGQVTEESKVIKEPRVMAYLATLETREKLVKQTHNVCV